MTISMNGEIGRLPAGVAGLDVITHGGLPRNRLTLVAGTAGSGKTVFAAQFLAEGIRTGEPGVFVTFEERPEQTRHNVASLGLTIGEWEEQGLWTFVNASPKFAQEVVIIGRYDLSALVERVKRAIAEVGAKRVAIDSIGALIAQFEDLGPARQALFQLAAELEELGVTSVMTAERPDDYGAISRYGFEEFVADNVILLRNALESERRRRTIEVLKLRGGSHRRGEHLFTLLPQKGVIVVPQDPVDFEFTSSHTRLPSGIDRLDEMLDGGFYDRSLVLVTGPTGTGKSLLSSQFIAGGVAAGEKALLVSFEESTTQLRRNADALGLAFGDLEDEGRLRLLCQAPEGASLEDHLLQMKQVIDEFGPDRVAIDSLSALERVATVRSFREYLLGLTFHIKTNAMLGLMTTTSTELGRMSSTDLHVSTISDVIILLRYVQVEAENRRALTVLKMRGSNHDKAQREFHIDTQGIHVGEPIAFAGPTA